MNRIVRVCAWLGSGYVPFPAKLNPRNYAGTFHMLIDYEDGRQRAVVQGPFSFGSEAGLYEAGHLLDRGMIKHPIWHDVVQGHLTEDQIVEEIEWVRSCKKPSHW